MQTELMSAPRAKPASVHGDEGFSIAPQGPFSLRESALFGFGHRHEEAFDGWMRVAFCLDGYGSQVGVALRQDDRGVVHGTLCGAHGAAASTAAVAGQVARMLSLDYDARSFAALGERDPKLAPLFAAAPGLRPPLFHSPYEAALWAVLNARRPRRTAAGWRAKLAQAAGASFVVAGKPMWSVPLPARLVEMGPPGIQAACGVELVRAQRMLAIAAAATRGELDVEPLRRRDLVSARAALRTLPGIGPFYADLVLIRATGHTDVLPANEPQFLALLGELYGLDGAASEAQAIRMGSAWSPWRTWTAVLVRAAGPRVLGRHAASLTTAS